MITLGQKYLGITVVVLNCSIVLLYLSSCYDQREDKPQQCNCKDIVEQPRSVVATKSKPTTSDKDWTKNRLPILVYNRVPKCGSSSMFVMMQRLAKKLKFPLLNINILGIRTQISVQDQEETVLYMNALPPNTIVLRHLFFVDFARFKSKWPAYINVIRDPVERFTTHYYYVQNGFVAKPYAEEKQSKVTLDEYISQKGIHGLKNLNPKTSTLAFFCGQDKYCKSYNSTEALKKAKEHAEKYYVAIGLTEDFNNTLRLFQSFFPSQFTGWEDISIEDATNKFKTYHRIPLKEESKPILQEYLKYEIEFYEFVKKRFYKQIDELKVNRENNET